MTQTVQIRSWALVNNTGKNLNKGKPEAEDNIGLLLSVFDSLNALYEKLCRLDYVMQRRIIEQSLR
jgi:hypothetical protein